MDAVIGIIAIVVAILNVCLFFKLWGACNNIKRIADKYVPLPKERKIDPESLSEEEAEKIYKFQTRGKR
ncbi:MAG: hypothetical protein K2G47_00965 [Muribaculum sp.]|nr:hypothetical protein [Muribaculum sp.]